MMFNLKKIKMETFNVVFYLICVCTVSIKSDVEVSTSTTRLPFIPPRRPVNNFQSQELQSQDILLHLQRINDRLTAMEARENHRGRKVDTMDYKLTKLEILLQERANTLEKLESTFTRRMEALEYESNKILTLLEVARDELEKVQKRQIETKVDISKLIPIIQSTDDDLGTSGHPAKLQIMQTTLNNLRRMSDETQQKLISIQSNVTQTSNTTRMILATQAKCLTKEYFYSFMRDFSEKETHHFVFKDENKNEQSFPRDCAEIMEKGQEESGIYHIQPKGSLKPFFAYCDMKTEGGGWTVIQRRNDGTVSFYRHWQDYKLGFGNLMNEHWLGNDKIHLLTNQAVYHLRVELEDFEDHTAHAWYTSFATGSESEGYAIKILGEYEGDAGDSLNYHSSMKFSTEDMDNDQWDGGNCAELHTGGWWFNGCDMSNLNGQYLGGEVPENYENKGLYWYEWHGPRYSLRKSEMKIRPSNFKSTWKNESEYL